MSVNNFSIFFGGIRCKLIDMGALVCCSDSVDVVISFLFNMKTRHIFLLQSVFRPYLIYFPDDVTSMIRT